MSDYLSNLAVRTLAHTPAIQPRLASLYEPERIPGVEIPESRLDEKPFPETSNTPHLIPQPLASIREHLKQTAIEQPAPTAAFSHSAANKLTIIEAGDEKHSSSPSRRNVTVTARQADITTKGFELEDHSAGSAQSSIPDAPGPKVNESHRVDESQSTAKSPQSAIAQSPANVADAVPTSNARILTLLEALSAEERSDRAVFNEASRMPGEGQFVFGAPRDAPEQSTKSGVDRIVERVVNQSAGVLEEVRPPVVAAVETSRRHPVAEVAPTFIVAHPQSVSHVPRPNIPSDAAAPPTQAETTVQVSIGRIEVRAVNADTRRSVQPSTPSSLTSLDEYLRQRAQGDNR